MLIPGVGWWCHGTERQCCEEELVATCTQGKNGDAPGKGIDGSFGSFAGAAAGNAGLILC